MSSFVIDIEADNLYPFQKKTWVIAVKKVGTDQRLKLYPYKSSPESVRKQLTDFIFQDPGIPVIIGHNYLGFDCWVMWKDYGITITVGKDTFCGREVRYFDTLFASQFFLPDRIGGHGLDDWGKRLGDHKIEYRKLLIEKGLLPKDAAPGAEFTFHTTDMDSYCEQDCSVAEQVYVQLNAQLEEEGSHNAFRLGQKTFFLMAAQGFTGFKFDSEKAVALKARIEGMIEDLRREVEPELPPRKLKKTEEAIYRIPAKPYTQNGQFSALMNKFIERVGAKVLSQTSIQVNGRTIPIVGHGLIQDTVPMLLDDQNALKDYFLNDLHWEPTLWNYKQKDGKPLRDEKGKLIKTSPKLQEAGKICENLLELDGDLPKKITRFMSLRNRLSILTGWLENPRLAWDGRLSAGSSGLAGTHRQRHHTIVNVPKAQDDVLLGKEFRSLFTVEKGNKLIGCDQAALEARCEAHWVYDFPGGKERANVLLSGDVHSINCKIFFAKEVKDFDINSPDFSKDHPGFKPYRSLSKNGGYGLLYGCTPKKLAATLRKNEREGPALYDAYWASNTSLKGFKDKLEYSWEREGKKIWIKGIDGRRLHSRSKHSLVNLCFQSTGAIIVDYALCLLDMKLGGLKLDFRGRPYYEFKGKEVKRVGYFHDEAITETDPSVTEEVAKIMEQCMVEAGVRLNLNVPLVGESKIDVSWDKTH
jgi:hypothetical protein